ncbi:hypothetical protein HYDPIDRAFT_39012 [Hydnomerulius pinastri MD-312]|nr:hypothetical protein HYDPIDRAFT_39012 [Hydnomerulius pinastri MD-312]
MATLINAQLQAAIEKIKKICDDSENRSQFFPFGGEGYKSCVRHYLESSCEIAACGIQPGSVADLEKIVKVIGKYRVPFAVKGGGHATSPYLSSTTGIQISMCRFNKIEIKKDDECSRSGCTLGPSHVHVGAGCLFGEVYREVVPHGLNIVGGSSIGGVGIAGWLLGGGYSLKTNQHGLGIDNIIEVQIVLPNGTSRVVGVSSVEEEDEDLFWAIKGGRDNFGIVTEFTIKAHPQVGPVFGCLLTYDPEEYEEVKIAIANFAQQEDEQACIEAAFRYSQHPGSVQSTLTVQCFYDGDLPEDDPFEEFMKIDHQTDSGGGDAVGHEFLPANALLSITSDATIPYKNSVPGMTSPAFWQSKPKKTLSELRKYSSYEEFDRQFSLINEVLDTQAIQSVSPYSGSFTVGPGAPTWSATHLGYISSHSGAGSNAAAIASSIVNLAPQAPDRINRSMVGIGENSRGHWGNVMVDVYTKPIIDEIARQASKASRQMLNNGGKRVVIDIWPFTKSMFNDSTPSAWPHGSDSANSLVLAYFLWEGSENDSFWINLLKGALTAIKAKVSAARDESAEPLPVYSNTALGPDHTNVEDIYGKNLDRLMFLRKKFDRKLVMDLARGFKIPRVPSTGDSESESESESEDSALELDDGELWD